MTDEPDPLSGLSESDRLSLLIGRVCRADVQLEAQLVGLHRALVAPSLAVYDTPLGFAPLLSGCSTMLAKADVPDEWQEAGRAALDAARGAHDARNRVAHDMWLRLDTENPEAWTRLQRKRGQLGQQAAAVTFVDVEAAIAALQRALVRISALHFGLLDHLPFYRERGMPSLPSQLEFVRDEFELLPDGGARPFSWSADPPSEATAGS